MSLSQFGSVAVDDRRILAVRPITGYAILLDNGQSIIVDSESGKAIVERYAERKNRPPVENPLIYGYPGGTIIDAHPAPTAVAEVAKETAETAVPSA